MAMSKIIEPVGGERTDDATRLLAQWNRQYAAALRSFFRRRGADAADCEDLTQDLFLRLAQRSEPLTDICEVEPYLMRTASNVVADWNRRRQARGAGLHEPVNDDLRDAAAGQEQVLLAKDALARLREALRQMPSRTERIFTMHHFDGLKYAEIAIRCGIAVRTVEDHMARANLFLLAALEGSL